MKKIIVIVLVFVFSGGIVFCQDQFIFPFGGGQNKLFIKEIIKLTGKDRPKICYLPTASGDGERGIIQWYETCYCATPLKHERGTVYDRYLEDIRTSEVGKYGDVSGESFWSYLQRAAPG